MRCVGGLQEVGNHAWRKSWRNGKNCDTSTETSLTGHRPAIQHTKSRVTYQENRKIGQIIYTTTHEFANTEIKGEKILLVSARMATKGGDFASSGETVKPIDVLMLRPAL